MNLLTFSKLRYNKIIILNIDDSKDMSVLTILKLTLMLDINLILNIPQIT